LLLALQEAGPRLKPLPPAGIERLFRVFNHPDFDIDEFCKEFPNQAAVPKHLAEVVLQAVSFRFFLSEIGDVPDKLLWGTTIGLIFRFCMRPLMKLLSPVLLN
jgi:hypothetical protein